MDHNGFSFIQCLSECVEFYEGAFDSANPRKGGVFNEVPKDHDVTDEFAAYQLASTPFPGHFGVFYKVNRPTKNEKEAEIIAKHRAKVGDAKDWQILQRTFDRLK
jgi:2-oxoglutarate ferredoxin oxidoreductase subunit beta